MVSAPQIRISQPIVTRNRHGHFVSQEIHCEFLFVGRPPYNSTEAKDAACNAEPGLVFGIYKL